MTNHGKRLWYLIVETYWRKGWVWCGCCFYNVPCTFVSNWIEGTTHESIFHKLWKWLLQVVCIFPIFIAFSHIELKAQLMSQFSMTNFENDFCKWYVSSLYLLLSHINVNEKFDLSMTNFENDFCKWYVSSLYLLLSHIDVNEKYDLSMTTFASGMYLPYIYCFLT